MQRETVLVVDDDEHCRQQCRTALEQAGYQVATARSADDALAACNLNPSLRQGCDLALVDYVMPGCDGFATFRRLKAVQPDLAGILLTGHTSLNVAIDALNLGFGQVVAKPIAPPDLVEAVQAALAERKTVLENARLRALTRLYDSLNQLATLVDPEELYRCIIDLAVAETSAHRVSLMLLDERCQWLRVVAATGLDRELASTARQRLGDPVSGWVLSHGVVLELGPDRPVPGPVRAALRRPEVTAAVCLPLYAAGEPLGVLNLSRLESQGGFQPGDLEITSVLAADAALTIQRLNLMQARARRERVATVGRLASTIIHDLRGPVTIIGGAAEMLADTNETAAEPLATIRDGVNELERMCRQLLSFARDSTTAVIEEFALAPFLEQVLADTAEEARAA
ncbi:MAG: response regulator, partial [Armatimonadetes bacterium]|nr:response regulator [Armatimonadota bacterium]